MQDTNHRRQRLFDYHTPKKRSLILEGGAIICCIVDESRPINNHILISKVVSSEACLQNRAAFKSPKNCALALASFLPRDATLARYMLSLCVRQPVRLKRGANRGGVGLDWRFSTNILLYPRNNAR